LAAIPDIAMPDADEPHMAAPLILPESPMLLARG
jgi:hypothetical protein